MTQEQNKSEGDRVAGAIDRRSSELDDIEMTLAIESRFARRSIRLRIASTTESTRPWPIWVTKMSRRSSSSCNEPWEAS